MNVQVHVDERILFLEGSDQVGMIRRVPSYQSAKFSFSFCLGNDFIVTGLEYESLPLSFLLGLSYRSRWAGRGSENFGRYEKAEEN
ncbi:MAG: hypothetical protein E6J74_15760 [Deltaproteobacteria bacterium]|nr:MAG: hypothetical protein E6J74_15760 [Deltaproteobacteria bacterium]